MLLLVSLFLIRLASLFAVPVPGLPLQITRIYDSRAAAAQIADLADYGITAAKLTAFKKKIDAFEVSLSKPRQQVATSSAAMVALAEQFKEADEVLNKCLGKLVFQFKDSAPDFFNEYQTARSIVDIRSTRKANKTTPTPTPTPQPA